jgi:uncharacterized protein (TIGR03792 family)
MMWLLGIWLFICIQLARDCDIVLEKSKAIEILVVTVRPNDMEHYLALDAEIWTNFLQAQDGFITKRNLLHRNESWRNATEVYHIIEWASFMQWKSISKEALTMINARFVRAFAYAPDVKSLPNDNGFWVVGPTGTL